jgi:hypothetical protein
MPPAVHIADKEKEKKTLSVIDDRYARLGGANGFLGAIVSYEQPHPR